ncbi:unnamed protein product [Miscanthus lutarioriparius]|uniref:Uncharacterized protein n=1 Tax=Miscanthus lutarioriparius TaxID=422564 RepID=A0A811NLP7_9POAL|nr:unnamed protein product [Miscanthus lutarioriparius]
MAEDALRAAPVMTPEEVQAEAELRMRDVSQRFGAIPEDREELLRLLEVVSPTRIDKSKGQQEDGGESSKRKRLQEAQETPLSKKNKMLDENLVGSRIKVWWPDDKMFYAGVIESFDSFSKKHKVSYDDGDVEVLVLKKERWEFISELYLSSSVPFSDSFAILQEQDTYPDAPSNM